MTPETRRAYHRAYYAANKEEWRRAAADPVFKSKGTKHASFFKQTRLFP